LIQAFRKSSYLIQSPLRTALTRLLVAIFIMMDWLAQPFLQGFFVDHRFLSDSSFSTEPRELIPFDVTLALTGSTPINPIALTDAVTKWLQENFEESIAALNYEYNFQQVSIRELIAGKYLSSSAYQITYEGRSFWGTDRNVPTETEVAAIQLETILDRNGLLDKLRLESDNLGLGSAVVDARSDLNRAAKPSSSNESSSESLDTVIIIAIVIAVLASLVLAVALLMAWRSGQNRNKDQSYIDGTAAPPASNVPNSPTRSPYSDAVSEDINSSLSAYYKSGMAGGYRANKNRSGGLNDAASVSSMESYGYSLDGYTSSIANVTTATHA
jgi:hypothetical protein